MNARMIRFQGAMAVGPVGPDDDGAGGGVGKYLVSRRWIINVVAAREGKSRGGRSREGYTPVGTYPSNMYARLG